MSQPRRDWSDANEKRLGGCRICGAIDVELAHVIGRKHDRPKEGRKTRWVNPDAVVPLCRGHHEAYDSHVFDLLPYLTLEEQIQAVQDAGGIEQARERTCPGAYAAPVARAFPDEKTEWQYFLPPFLRGES